MILDAVLVGIVVLVTWCVASEGAWGAALTMLSVLLSAILATNFFEVTADFLQANISDSYEWQHRWDVIALVGLFAAFIFAFRTVTERIMPIHLEVHGLAYDVIRWLCGAGTGCVTMALFLTALQTAPLPPGFLGFTPEPERRGGPLGQAGPDLKWLGFMQHMTEFAFNKGGTGPIFDGPRFRLHPGGQPEVLPSFPLRYASRRERLYGAPPAAATSSAPPGAPGPGGGGGTSGTRGPTRF